MKCVSHEQAVKLLHNKFVMVLGDSIQRGVYKDIVLLLQREQFLSHKQLKTKGERSFELDCLVEGGSLETMHNGTGYREVRQFQSDHHLVRFYFVTRIYSRYMQSVLEDLRKGLKPDVVIVNSCIWDISRYGPMWVDDYKENLHKFFRELQEVLPPNALVVWNLTMPLGKKIFGGFMVPELEHKARHLRYDVVDANFDSGAVADGYGLDVLDLHYNFRLSLQHRVADGIHWNPVAHRRITSLLLQHAALAWGVVLRPPHGIVENDELCLQKQAYSPKAVPVQYRGVNFCDDNVPQSSQVLQGYLSLERNVPPAHVQQRHYHPAPRAQPDPPQHTNYPASSCDFGPVRGHLKENERWGGKKRSGKENKGYVRGDDKRADKRRGKKIRQESGGEARGPYPSLPLYTPPQYNHAFDPTGCHDYVMRSRGLKHHYSASTPYERPRRY